MSKALNQTDTLSAVEKRALLARLLEERAGKAAASGGGEACFHRQFEAQAARTPNAVAVGFEGRTLTYRELNERANRLAHRLRAMGVGPEVLVGLFVERSPEMVVGLLGILKAGGAYIPLDPAFPSARIALMLEDARVAVLVTEQALRAEIPATDARVVCLDSEWEQIDAESAENPASATLADHLAYVIYTSGSTGRPKGVMIPHGPLANLLRSMRTLLGVTDRDIFAAVTTLSFDIAAMEIYLPLLQGARVEVISRAVASDAHRLAEHLARGGVTFLQATPATWRLLLEGGWEGLGSLTMLCGGESLPRDLAERLAPKGAALWNLYGPTETTIWSSSAKVEVEDGPVPIGKPISNTQVYVLDARFRPVPVGVTGELYIGGAGLARGYLSRPALTAEQFVPDPFGETKGGRLYRTGDLARWRPDGRLECLGRVDHQVKIRGYRVELGEIEAALAKQPAVREVVVVARHHSAGEKILVAYLVPRSGLELIATDLRRALGEALPDYMVPSAFVSLDALPLTPNGKVDRKALPDPDQSRIVSGNIYVPPRGPIEESLVAIWGELLGRDRIGVHDNFFDLGGYSLVATRLVARVRDVFGVEPPLRDFFESATIAGLARMVEAALRDEAGVQTPPIERIRRDGPLPASFAQQRLWFLDQLEPGSASYNIPIAVKLEGNLDRPALGRALNEVVRRHEVLRTTFASEGGVPYQVIAPTIDIAMPIVDLADLPNEPRNAEASRRIDEEAGRPFDLARGPLIRAGLIRMSEGEHIVLVTMHHIVSDGWSIGVLIREVAALYEAFTHAQPSPLPEPAIQYADFAAWQRLWLQGEVLEAQLSYWKGQLAGVSTLDLPTDRPRPASSRGRGDTRTLDLPAALVDGLRALSRQAGSTLYMTTLAAFQTLLHRYTGQDDLAVGSPIAGRTRSEIEDLIGFFVNTMVLRGDLSRDPSFRELLKRTRTAALGAYAHQDLPFEQLVTLLHPDRQSGRSPLFQVMFVLQNAPMPALPSPDLIIAPLEPTNATAKFDLTLFLTEKAVGMAASIEYDVDLFDSATIDRMLGHFKTLVEAIVADPDGPIGSLPMIGEEERRQMLRQWNDQGDDALFGDDLDSLSDEELDSMLLKLSPEAPNDE